MKNHLEKECPNSSGTCHRCHGFYKATEEHDCYGAKHESYRDLQRVE
jgi:hypothetical protein